MTKVNIKGCFGHFALSEKKTYKSPAVRRFQHRHGNAYREGPIARYFFKSLGNEKTSAEL